MAAKKDKTIAERQEYIGQDFVKQANPLAMKFDKPGESYNGIVQGVEPYQVRDFETRELLSYDDGTPIMALAVFIANTETGEVRTFYVQSLTQQRNLGSAFKQADITGLAEGDHISITYLENKKTKYGSKAKVYDIVIKPV